MKFSNCDQRASTELNSLPTCVSHYLQISKIHWFDATYSNDTFQVAVQSVDVLKYLLHTLSVPSVLY